MGIVVNVIVVLILLAIVTGIILHLVRAKKRGKICIGCPYAKQCGDSCDDEHSFRH
jgi:hypothetical protein